MLPFFSIITSNGLFNNVFLLTTALIFLFGVSPTSAQNPLKDNSPDCSCYLTSGPSASYFSFHRFHDFRALPGSHIDIPSNVVQGQDSGTEDTTSPFFDSTAWNADWHIQNWARNVSADGTVKLVNSAQNVYIGTVTICTQHVCSRLTVTLHESDQNDLRSPTYLTLRTTRLQAFQSTGEVESLQKNVLYASIRLRARVLGSPGAIASMFLYNDDNNESDTEILTSDPSTHIRYSNQPTVDKGGNLIAAASNDVMLPKDTEWTAWNEHRIDWLPGRSTWYINDVSVASMTYGVPKKPCSLTLNMWSDGGIWSGNMSVGDEAYLQVQWIEMVFNTSGPVTGPPGATRGKRWLGLPVMLEKRKGKGCGTVCTIDGVQKVGFPEADGKSMATVAAPGSAAASVVRGEFAFLVFFLASLGGILAVLG